MVNKSPMKRKSVGALGGAGDKKANGPAGKMRKSLGTPLKTQQKQIDTPGKKGTPKIPNKNSPKGTPGPKNKKNMKMFKGTQKMDEEDDSEDDSESEEIDINGPAAAEVDSDAEDDSDEGENDSDDDDENEEAAGDAGVEGEEESDDEEADESDEEVPEAQPIARQEIKQRQTKSAEAKEKASGKSFTLFVKNIPFTASKKDIQNHFKGINITRISIPVDNKSKRPRGFVFMEVDSEESREKCLAMNETAMSGRVLTVVPSDNRPKPRRSGKRKQEGGEEVEETKKPKVNIKTANKQNVTETTNKPKTNNAKKQTKGGPAKKNQNGVNKRATKA